MCSRGTADFSRDQPLLDGFLKHREPGLVSRWRHRYVVFKVATAGRLSFTIYKDKPPTPSNELLEIPIEEYGGLDANLKMDGERHVFGVITTQSTECFAAESHEVLEEWCSTLREFLGKELVLSISIPYKQNMLRPGRATIRIRNTGFTITTAEVPPKCQGSWQILHIRKFGGSEQFRFETGTKCPTGQYLYVIDTNDNEKMKSVFTDLSMHKPIFQDDRMGRRMTQEHNVLLNIRSRMSSTELLQAPSHSQLSSRRSLQNIRVKYENHSEIRRTSVQHENSRSRSNAILENSDVTQTLPALLTSRRENVYYNQPRSLNAPPTSKRASSDPPPQERIYQNTPTHKTKPKNRRLSSESMESEDDDFVDVQEIIENTGSGCGQENHYYNLRSVIKEPTPVENNGVYENMVPSQKRSSGGSDNREQQEEEEHPLPMYSNVTIHHDEKPKSLTPELSRHSTLVNNDHTSFSCENLSSPTNDKPNGIKDTPTSLNDTAYHSDTEINQVRHHTLTRDDNKRSPSPLIFTNNMESEKKSNSRPSAYDHLEPLKRHEDEKENNKFYKLSTTSSSSSPPSSHKKDVKVGGAWTSRRVHAYEDVDVHITDRSSSSSIDSAFNDDITTLSSTTSLDSYQRKLSLLGRGHSYEYIEVKREKEGPTSPTRSKSPNHGTLSASRPTLPLQDVSLDKSGIQATPLSNESPKHKSSRKPKPAPRIKNNDTANNKKSNSSSRYGSNSKPHPPSATLQAPAIPPRPAKPIGTHETLPTHFTTTNYKSKILQGFPRSSSHNELLSEATKPNVPPRIKDDHETINYIPIYIKSGPRPERQESAPAKSKGSIAAKRSLPSTRKHMSQDVNYSDINHFLTQQIQVMREEREIEKGMAAL